MTSSITPRPRFAELPDDAQMEVIRRATRAIVDAGVLSTRAGKGRWWSTYVHLLSKCQTPAERVEAAERILEAFPHSAT